FLIVLFIHGACKEAVFIVWVLKLFQIYFLFLPLLSLGLCNNFGQRTLLCRTDIRMGNESRG
ncbi:hypothetical protein BDN71DRAFT_1552937, partial [Pleurotus eryngii]